jgi:heme a synthase
MSPLSVRVRRLAWATVGFTYLLMVWGNIVSSTGSGLACPDWPLCHGTVAPPFRLDIMFEWGHRILAATATLLIVTTVISVLRASRDTRSPLRRTLKLLLALLGFQILLGGTTVLLGLSLAISTIHLLLANLVWGGLILLAAVVTYGDPEIRDASPRAKRLAWSALVAFLVQLGLGALVRHGHAGLACPGFPQCLTGILPDYWDFSTFVAFAHRWWGVALIGVFVHLALACHRIPGLRGPSAVALALSLAQVTLGVLTVLTSLHVHTRAAHAALGYALWGVLFYLAVRIGVTRPIWKPGEERPAAGGALAATALAR